MNNTVKIIRYNPIWFDLKLYVFGRIINFSLVDMSQHFFTVSDGIGLKFDTHTEAELYCQDNDYTIVEDI